jgi:hypothetical protein
MNIIRAGLFLDALREVDFARGICKGSVRHQEAIDLVTAWIQGVVDADYPDAECAP